MYSAVIPDYPYFAMPTPSCALNMLSSPMMLVFECLELSAIAKCLYRQLLLFTFIWYVCIEYIFIFICTFVLTAQLITHIPEEPGVAGLVSWLPSCCHICDLTTQLLSYMWPDNPTVMIHVAWQSNCYDTCGLTTQLLSYMWPDNPTVIIHLTWQPNCYHTCGLKTQLLPYMWSEYRTVAMHVTWIRNCCHTMWPSRPDVTIHMI